MYVDLTEPELWRYRSSYAEPEDFDAFWSRTLDDAARHPIAVTATPVKSPLATVEVHDITFAGFGGHPVRGWLYVPVGIEPSGVGVVQYQGYGGGRGHHLEHLLWSAAGHVHLMMDSRGQGAAYRRGATADPVGTDGPAIPGVMTRGIESPDSYYYRRLYVDAVRAVDALRDLSPVVLGRVVTVGASQGGALSLAAAALRDDVAAAVALVPFMCDIRRASTITDREPYKEIGRYLVTMRDRVEEVFGTLGYFDGVGLARRITCPTLISAALMDATCPPSTVFGAYHELAGPKEISVWTYNSHEGGGPDDDERALRFVAERAAGR